MGSGSSTTVPSRNSKKEFDTSCLMRSTTANKKGVLGLLENLKPDGGTNLYAAIANGTSSAYGMALALLKETAQSDINIRLINVVLTDGEDTSQHSNQNFIQVSKILQLLHGTSLNLADSCQTFLVGIGKSNFSSLRNLTKGCGQYCTFQQVSDIKIESLFEQIEVKMGIANRIAIIETEQAAIVARKQELALRLQENRYVVIFTIDHSGSMEGDRWERVKKGLRTFLDKLHDNDLFCIQLFNNDTCWLFV